MNVHAIDRFFHNYRTDPHTGEEKDVSVELAQYYCGHRHVDYAQLCKDMEWKITTKGVLQCRIYRQSILLTYADSALHAGQPAGGGELLIDSDDGREPELFEHIDQVLAYLLATFW